MRRALLIVAVMMAMLSTAVAQEHAATPAATSGATAAEAAHADAAAAPAAPIDGSAYHEAAAPGPAATAPGETAPQPEAITDEHAAATHGDAAAAHGDTAAAHGDTAAAHGDAAATHGDTAAAHGDAAAAHGEGDHGEGHGPNYLPKIVNFLIFASILVFVARKPIAAFFGDRRRDIDESFTKAEAAQRDVASKVTEMELRLAALDEQVKDILTRAQDQAESERQAILEAARVNAQKLLTQAEAQVADLEAASVRRLKAMAADLAVDGARELIEKQLGADDRNRLFDRTLKGLSKASTQ